MQDLFDLTQNPIDPCALYRQMTGNEADGGLVCFEGRVRRNNDGETVDYLVYTAYEELALTTGQDIIAQAKRQFAISRAVCIHRFGRLNVGDTAVWVGVSAGHRDAAFAACRFIIDTVKAQVPIWKQEFYQGRDSAWLANPESH
ncbi:MAG: molybdenum cofactor biosynthesis protein MoaE [Neisseria sp.]|nr:molybdenum cofactor biosynthesis protein MoaE [Neisseria sp.]